MDWMILPKDEDIFHHGVKGQKWGIRRYQNEDGSYTKEGLRRYAISPKKQEHLIKRINLMYDRANKWTDRKIRKLDKKGKTVKANVMRVMRNENEKARKEKIANIKKMRVRQDLKKSKKQDWMDVLFGGQDWMKNNTANMTTFLSRLGEYNTQRGMRWASNFTLESTLARMTPKDAYNYLKRKHTSLTSYASGYNSGASAN